MYVVQVRGRLVELTYLEFFERAQAASQRSVPVQPLMMYGTKCTIAAFDLGNHKELMTLTHGVCKASKGNSRQALGRGVGKRRFTM